MSFNTDWFEENHRGHIKTAELFYSCKEERPENYKAAGLDHCWLNSTIAEKAKDCFSVSICLYILICFLKCIPDMCCSASFTKSNSTDLKSFIHQVEVQLCPTPFLMQTCPIICIIQPYKPTATNNMKIKLVMFSLLYDPSEVCYHHRTAGTIWG